jgi:hypothetical protein
VAKGLQAEKVEARRQIRRITRPRDHKTLTLHSMSPPQAHTQGFQAEKVKVHRQIRWIARPWDRKTWTEVVVFALGFSNFLSRGPAPSSTTTNRSGQLQQTDARKIQRCHCFRRKQGPCDMRPRCVLLSQDARANNTLQDHALPQGTKCADTSTRQALDVPRDPTRLWQDPPQERVSSPRVLSVPTLVTNTRRMGLLQQPDARNIHRSHCFCRRQAPAMRVALPDRMGQQQSRDHAPPQGNKCADTSTRQALDIPRDPTRRWQDSPQEQVRSPRGLSVPTLETTTRQRGQLKQPDADNIHRSHCFRWKQAPRDMCPRCVLLSQNA